MEQYALANDLSVWAALGRMLDEQAFSRARRSRLAAFQQHD